MSHAHIELATRDNVGRAVSQRRRWIHGAGLAVGLLLLMQGTGAAETIGFTNVALGKRAIGSLPCTPLSGADKAVDGRTTNIFTDKWCSAALGTKWLQVDLGTNYQLTSVVVKHAGVAGENPIYNTSDYAIHTSRDGQVWSTAVIVVGNRANVTSHPVTGSARYIRLTVTRSTQTLNAAARIYELEVFA